MKKIPSRVSRLVQRLLFGTAIVLVAFFLLGSLRYPYTSRSFTLGPMISQKSTSKNSRP